MIIYRSSVALIDGVPMYEDPNPVDVHLEFYKKFTWTKIIRIDIPEEKSIVYMSDVRIALEGVWLGLQLAWDLQKGDKYFENYKLPKGGLEL